MADRLQDWRGMVGFLKVHLWDPSRAIESDMMTAHESCMLLNQCK